MVNININEKIYERWAIFYKMHDKLEYPTLKNFTEKKILEIISLHSVKTEGGTENGTRRT
jgi:hypothetical protein|tara:strand:+ start:26 stop:205 length:180 start_codon:yes stop_codon:yes gene_type:complete